MTRIKARNTLKRAVASASDDGENTGQPYTEAPTMFDSSRSFASAT
jgi:hypothetical protein